MKELVIFVTLILVACHHVQAGGPGDDPCYLPAPVGSNAWSGNVTLVQACFNSIPFSSTRAANTLSRLRQLVDLYAFTDISKDSGAPWNLQVDLVGGLNAIEAKTYQNDYAFHSDLATLFNSLNDAHTLYTFPEPYYRTNVLRPFGVQPVNDNGILKFYLTQSSNIDATSYKNIIGFDPTPYFGGELTAIDGTPIVQWFKAFVDKYVGFHKDQSVRFNAALSAYGSFMRLSGTQFSISDLATSCTMKINGTDVVVPFVATIGGGIPNSAAAVTQIDTPITLGKRSITARDNLMYQPDIHKERREQFRPIKVTSDNDQNGDGNSYRKRFDYNSLNTQAVQKRSDQQASDQIILSVKSGNLTNLQIVDQTDDGTIWWGTYTTSDKQVVPYLRIYSFLANADGFTAILRGFSNYTSTNQIDRVIVDVSANGGGYICLSYQAASIFSEKFRGTNNYERYDLRRTQTLASIVDAGMINGSDYLRISDRQLYTNNSWFNPRTVTRGGQASNLTQQFYYPASCYTGGFLDAISVTRFPADPIVITDGTAGSASSLFISKFLEYNVGRVFSYGGFPGTVMDSSSFAGGNVREWLGFVYEASRYTISNQPQQFSTSAKARFTQHEVYIGTVSDVPRDFRFMPGQYHAYYYDYFTNDVAYLGDSQPTADLYETAAVAWTLPAPVAPVAAPQTPVAAPKPRSPAVKVSGGTSVVIGQSFVVTIAMALFVFN